jgi:hypothetical protein
MIKHRLIHRIVTLFCLVYLFWELLRNQCTYATVNIDTGGKGVALSAFQRTSSHVNNAYYNARRVEVVT